MAKRARRPARMLVPAVAVGAVALAATGAALVPGSGPQERPRFTLAIHGGAGTILRENMTPEREAAYREELTEALMAGHAVLEDGGSSLDAVVATIRVMEDSPLFNAGKGAVFTSAGSNELDAAVMEGHTLNAGAVAGVKHIKNPIDLARLVMERSRHVLLAREGAEEFALEQGMPLVAQGYFFTERRWESMLRRRAAEARGTVGAVALDAEGHLAAATSTGGVTAKRWGRIGDSPIIGAGTYADGDCAVSATGTGEYFMRNVVAHDICARVRYLGESLAEAAEHVVMEKLVAQGGDGGVIALDAMGRIAMPFNTAGMYRGHVGPDGRPVVAMYRE